MLSIEKSKMEHRMLILLSRFSPDFTQKRLIPEIETNCINNQVDHYLVKNFQKYKFAENSLYFHHAYAYADIPIGQEYDIIARISKGVIVTDSIVKCKTTVLAFFSAYKIQPLSNASHGHHENSLIQFQNGIPDMIFDLYEMTEKTTSVECAPEICLCSYETLKANSTAALEI